jgi:hypothetical protein
MNGDLESKVTVWVALAFIILSIIFWFLVGQSDPLGIFSGTD